MNLARILEGHPPEARALVSRGHEVSYGQLQAQVAALRGGLVGLGIEPGDRVGILCANNTWFVLAYLATLGVGAVAVPLNPTSPGVEVAGQLAAIGAVAVVVGPAGAGAMASLDRSAVPTLRHVIAPVGVDVGAGVTVEALLDTDAAPLVERQPDDVAVLIFTAGTAGSPKAAMLSHANLWSNIDQLQHVPERTVTPDDVVLGVLPLFHIFGLNVVLGVTLAGGGSVVLVERFDPASALDTIGDWGVTIVSGAPTMWTAWAGMTSAPKDAFRTVRLAVSGASKLADEVAEAIERHFGVEIREGYGLTEASPVVTSSAVMGGGRRGSIGRPVPGVEVRLVDEEGEDAPLGDSGEIWVRGPNVFLGYWEDAEATANALTDDGWLRTGDIAVADDSGALWIVDRAKDLIIVSGFNVYPVEVEEALLEHPGIEAVAVVGVSHPYSGETVKAYVVAKPGHTLEEEDIIAFAASRLARYKCPTKVQFMDEIPTGMGGKVLRRTLRWLSESQPTTPS